MSSEETEMLAPLSKKYCDVAGNVLSRICLLNYDITKLKVDAIVNAANRGLKGGGGVDGAIHLACGHRELQKECQELGHCDTGDAKATSACRLTANGVKKIIHTVGPIVNSTSNQLMNGYREQLVSCYSKSLEVAVQNGCRTIAFPCISTGIYGYPNDDAAESVGKFLIDWLTTNSDNSKIDMVVLCTFLQKDRQLYENFFDKYAEFLKKND
ncbi:hypothetical protein WR25_22577 [Diploscapter pachys]|uniref:Macro domain-containing protein n=1 Tax=Diploscapter pachys TaxID=2018661 RepID=A0A2A2KJM7_9BILA|nr:hypothetical protein WR25_22577 [Diploscapter pachys]